MPEAIAHGGDLVAASARYGSPEGGWLDLSTGINPEPWPLPPLPAAVAARLPQADGELEAAARAFYQAPHCLAVPGSQAAIGLLPRLLPPGEVAVLGPTYPEHAHRWRLAGHRVHETDAAGVEAGLDRWRAVVVVNPDNPTGRLVPRRHLQEWHARLARRGGWLVVDEAFAEVCPEASLAPASGDAGLVVLRSLGKFFGLPGLRLGFVLAAPPLLRALDQALGPWAVSAPARWWGARALADRAWQTQARARLEAKARRLDETLAAAGLKPAGGTALYRWLPRADAAVWQDALARAGVWTRHYPAPQGLRIGLPGDETGWRRLQTALDQARRNTT